MKKWEYQYIPYNPENGTCSHTSGTLVETLKTLGYEGWELVTIIKAPFTMAAGNCTHTLILKRESKVT